MVVNFVILTVELIILIFVFTDIDSWRIPKVVNFVILTVELIILIFVFTNIDSWRIPKVVNFVILTVKLIKQQMLVNIKYYWV